MMVYSPSQRFMASQSHDKPEAPRPGITRLSSFSPKPANDENDALKPPKRAHTFQNGSPSQTNSGSLAGEAGQPDAFEKGEESDDEDAAAEITRTSIELDELPIELITLTDNFVESLSAKVHSTPPNIEKLSQLFQDFYALGSSHIGTHISALATRQKRDASPAASTSSISSAASRLKSKAAALGKDKPKSEAEQQMLTADELADRRRARRALEAKRSLLEEAVERRLCEGIYDRIYRHRSTQDEAQDDKLRSKTAALALVGIGPADLGIDLGDDATQTPEAAAAKSAEIRERLGEARKDLVRMTESKYPLGKLNRLKAAHRSIVDTLAYFHPSASADEIMPMLIYTLITLPPEDLHVISDVHFIQYFRWEHKLTGEAAYCLTNLEAAVSFLENVDLATLREDEHLSGPPKLVSHPGTPKAETFPPAYFQSSGAASQTTSEGKSGGALPSKQVPVSGGLKPNTVLRNRRLSDLVNTPAQAFGAASDAVMNTADQSIKTISTSLGESYKFLVGKLRENQESPRESIVVPRTLDDARKLVSTPPIEEEDEIAVGTLLDPASADNKRTNIREGRFANRIGSNRDASADSARSGRSASSSRKTLFSEDPKPAAAPASNQNPAMLEQMRTLSNSFNPMARFSNIPMIRGFSRTASNPPPPTVSKDVAKPADGGDLATAFPDIAAALPPKKITKVAPPNKRFMEVQSPGDLKLNEVVDLLRDYRRLAGALKNLGAFEDD